MTARLPSIETFQRNLAALAAIAPDFCAHMSAMTPPASRVVEQPGDPADINLAIGDALFYPAAGAVRTAALQVGDYLDRPERLTYPPPPRTLLDEDVTDCVRERLAAMIPPPGPERLAQGPMPNRGGVMVVFGVGLGHHLDLLFEAIEFRDLILIEPYPELLWHSLWLQDWSRWIEVLAARGGGLFLLSDDDADTTAAALVRYLRTDCFGTSNGSYVYLHHSSPALEACHRQAAYQVQNTVRGTKGFFEDQLLMLRNTTQNLSRHAVTLVVNNPLPAQPLPAIIVGAGPSLDRALPDLARLQGKAVIFSAGTTLRTLMNHGITPDFQCEIENGARNVEALLPVAERHDLSGITLLASTTIDPQVAERFDRRIFYLRDRMVSAAVYGTPERTIHRTSPNCMTLALRMAAEFGFRDVYLFGVDHGSRDPGRHHAADSVWMTNPEWAEKYETIARPMNIVMPGNFGGRVYTNLLLKHFHDSAQELLEALGHVRVFNCSDGARLRGATAKLPGKVDLAEDRSGHARALAAIDAACERHGAGDLVDPARVRALTDALHRWAAMVLDALRELRATGRDLVAWYDVLHHSFEKIGDEGVSIRFLAEGSTLTMYHLAFHHALWHRGLNDTALQDALLDGLDTAFARMSERLEEISGNE